MARKFEEKIVISRRPSARPSAAPPKRGGGAAAGPNPGGLSNEILNGKSHELWDISEKTIVVPQKTSICKASLLVFFTIFQLLAKARLLRKVD